MSRTFILSLITAALCPAAHLTYTTGVGVVTTDTAPLGMYVADSFDAAPLGAIGSYALNEASITGFSGAQSGMLWSIGSPLTALTGSNYLAGPQSGAPGGLRITFANPVKSFGFDLWTTRMAYNGWEQIVTDTIDLEVFFADGSSRVFQLTTGIDALEAFLGFTSDAPIRAVELRSALSRIAIDNLRRTRADASGQLGEMNGQEAVPEPETAAFVFAGGAAVLIARRLNRQEA